VALLVKANKIMADPDAAITLLEAIKNYEMNIDTVDLKKQKKRIGSDLKELSQKYVEHREQYSAMYM